MLMLFEFNFISVLKEVLDNPISCLCAIWNLFSTHFTAPGIKGLISEAIDVSGCFKNPLENKTPQNQDVCLSSFLFHV